MVLPFEYRMSACSVYNESWLWVFRTRIPTTPIKIYISFFQILFFPSFEHWKPTLKINLKVLMLRCHVHCDVIVMFGSWRHNVRMFKLIVNLLFDIYHSDRSLAVTTLSQIWSGVTRGAGALSAILKGAQMASYELLEDYKMFFLLK